MNTDENIIEKNRAKILAYSKEYFKKNPEKVKEYRLNRLNKLKKEN